TFGAGIVSAAGVQEAAAVVSAPDDHFAASPGCCVMVSASGRIDGAGGCPTVCAGIISSAGVQRVAAGQSAPDDHFTAGPDCRVNLSRSGRAGGVRWSPRVVAAGTRWTQVVRQARDLRKRVVGGR